jgi:anti-sigma regulatory factor (Ser/Thr protein kinase)
MGLKQKKENSGSGIAWFEEEALINNYTALYDIMSKHLMNAGCSKGNTMRIMIAVEEIYVNICHYAYAPDTGKAFVHIETTSDPKCAVVTFVDSGVPYDPTAKEDPDITLSAEERKIGGLGIFMTKQIMDEVKYEYKDGLNILTLIKYF